RVDPRLVGGELLGELPAGSDDPGGPEGHRYQPYPADQDGDGHSVLLVEALQGTPRGRACECFLKRDSNKGDVPGRTRSGPGSVRFEGLQAGPQRLHRLLDVAGGDVELPELTPTRRLLLPRSMAAEQPGRLAEDLLGLVVLPERGERAALQVETPPRFERVPGHVGQRLFGIAQGLFEPLLQQLEPGP